MESDVRTKKMKSEISCSYEFAKQKRKKKVVGGGGGRRVEEKSRHQRH
jgi:hypothetical protein